MTDNGKLVVRLVGDGLVYPFDVEVAGERFRGTVRPATPLELERYRRDLREAASDPDKFHAARVAFYAAHLATWELVDETGREVPVSAASIRGLPGVLFDRLGDVTAGDAGVRLLGN